ncbi:hypothetical protein ACSBR1_020693 [Camellia fascicularis]
MNCCYGVMSVKFTWTAIMLMDGTSKRQFIGTHYYLELLHCYLLSSQGINNVSAYNTLVLIDV